MHTAGMDGIAGVATACGPRADNQDCALSLPEAGLYVVADGMGGLADGRASARLAVETVAQAAESLQADLRQALHNPTVSVVDLLERLFWRVNDTVRTATAARHAPRTPPPSGCTLTLALVIDQVLVVAHVGDSRAYLIGAEDAQQLTEDHSVAAARVRRGRMTEEEARTSPLRNKLYQAIGTSEDLDVDVLEVDLHAGDRVLLCSDGLWEPLSTADIVATVRGRNPLAAAEALVERATVQGLIDNTTALVFDPGQCADGVHRIGALRATTLFRDFDDTTLRRLAPYFKLQKIAAGDQIIEEGRMGQALYVLGQGSFDVERRGQQISRIHAPTLMGEIALIRDSRRTASLRAVTDGWALRLNRHLVDDLVSRQPELGAKLMLGLAREVAERLIQVTDQMLDDA